MDEIALHILDIGMNSVAAGANHIEITVVEDPGADRLEVAIADDGKGMEAEYVSEVLNGFASSKEERKRRIGLGLALLKQTAETCDGGIRLESEPGKGTRVEAWMRHSDLDRPPVGNLADTIFALSVGVPTVDVEYTYRKEGTVTHFDSAEVRRTLRPGTSLQSPEGVRAVRRALGSKE